MTRKRRTWGLLTILAIAAAGSMIAAGSRPARAASPAGGTTVTSSGGAVAITVNLDLCCATDASEQTVYGPMIADYVKQAEDVWNQALAKLPYKGCFPIQVRFNVRLLNQGEKPRPDAHNIHIDLSKPGRPYSTDPGTSDHTQDTTTVYTQPVGGEFFYASMDEETWQHEIGHLMGLGDDYLDQSLGDQLFVTNVDARGQRKSGSIPGRKGTLMDSGSEIDQVLAGRIGDIATKAGLKLPHCWKGDVHMIVTFPHVSCTLTMDNQLALSVGENGRVSGTSRGETLYDESCFGQGQQRLNFLTVPVTGKLVRDRFELRTRLRLGLGLPVTIPLVSPTVARANTSDNAGGWKRTYKIELHCTACLR